MRQLHQKQREKAQNDKQKRFSIKKKINPEADDKTLLQEENDEKVRGRHSLPILSRKLLIKGWVSCSDCHRWSYYSLLV